MPEWLQRLITDYGHVVVFLGVFLENAGVPVPGETTLLAAAFLAERGMFKLHWIVLTAMCAAILGDNLGFWIGRRGGRALAEKHGPRLGLTPARLQRLEGYFARHGAKTVFFARFITGLRVFGAPLAGMSKMPWRAFIVWNAVGAVAWASVFGALGFFFGQSWDVLEKWIGRAAIVVAIVVGVVVLVIVARKHGRQILDATRGEMLRPLGKVAAFHGAIGAGCFTMLAVLAAGIRIDAWGHFDRTVLEWIHSTLSPTWYASMFSVSFVGSWPVIYPLLGGVIVLALVKKQVRAGLVVACAYIVVEFGDLFLKQIYRRPRPGLWAGFIPPDKFSFPSGHAMSAVAGFGLIAFLVARMYPPTRRMLMLLIPPLAFAIGFSRLYLGVHFPTDVLGGWAAGGLVYCAAVMIVDAGDVRQAKSEP